MTEHKMFKWTFPHIFDKLKSFYIIWSDLHTSLKVNESQDFTLFQQQSPQTPLKGSTSANKLGVTNNINISSI